MNTLQKNIKILGVLAVVQAVLAVVLWQTGGRAPGQAAHPLLGMEESAITALEVISKPGADGKPGESVKLVKQGTEWVVASAGDFPAKKDKVEEVVKKLAAIKVKSPIATQAANHNALRVGKETYGKEVVVTAGGESKRLVVGSGSGSSINVRFADGNDVYQGRGLSEYQVSNQARSYVETQYVKADTEKVTAVSVTNAKGTLTFRKEGEKWLFEQLPAGATLDDTKVTGFIGGLVRVNLERPVGKEVKPEMRLSGPGAVQVQIEATQDDKPLSLAYTVGAEAGSSEADGFYVKSKDNDFVIVATKWATEGARTKGPEDFVKTANEPPPTPDDGMGGPPPGMPPHGFAPPGP